jgi:hypothetical protein
MFLHFFVLATVAWWMMSAVDLFQRLILGLSFQRGRTQTTQRNLAQHLFCWGMPLICVLATIVADQYGYDQYLFFSWIAFDPNIPAVQLESLSGYDMSIYVLMLPIAACFIIGWVFIAIVLVYLIKYDADGLKKFQDQMEQSKSFWFKLQQAVKLLGFSVLLIPLFVIIVIRTVSVVNGQVQWANDKNIWGQDLLVTFSGMFSFKLTILISV